MCVRECECERERERERESESEREKECVCVCVCVCVRGELYLSCCHFSFSTGLKEENGRIYCHLGKALFATAPVKRHCVNHCDALAHSVHGLRISNRWA